MEKYSRNTNGEIHGEIHGKNIFMQKGNSSGYSSHSSQTLAGRLFKNMIQEWTVTQLENRFLAMIVLYYNTSNEKVN